MTRDKFPAKFGEYLPDGEYHEGHVLKEPPGDRYGDLKDHTALCAVCHGYGGWNLQLNAYGPGNHFNAFCSHCNGWGWVRPGENDCAPHAWEEISRPSGHRSGLHTDRCKKCGKQRTYDTSD